MHENAVSLYNILIGDNFMIILEAIDPKSPAKMLVASLEHYDAKYGVRLTIHDCRGVLYFPNGDPLFPGRGMHMHPYCITGRYEIPGWNKQCHEECMVRTENRAHRLKTPFIRECWKGVTELVVPIVRQDSVMLIFYAGVFRSPAAVPPADLRESWENLPVADHELLKKMALELQIFGQGILYYTEFYRDRAGASREKSAMIRRFVEDHAHEQITLANLAKALNLSRPHTCHMVKFHFGKSFHALLCDTRMERARNLLRSTEMPIKMIASVVGFSNEFYFSRIFTRECGIPPGEYRKSHSPASSLVALSNPL